MLPYILIEFGSKQIMCTHDLNGHVCLIFSRYGVYFQIHDLPPEVTSIVMAYVGPTALGAHAPLVSAIRSASSGIQVCWIARMPPTRGHQYVERVQGLPYSKRVEISSEWGMDYRRL